ncbi:MAG TPA: zf-HC2 domain-containing protein [Acetivibrio sp.]|uniref:zf-HC2 domain-containing protein n=1 Tax=Acetivibrio sp. TaxID=1872092 RepID=UPI002C005C6E|nr:zf-HC2 domain-containing protein [Acetivibrio sp.]HOM01800.1 zf-HC2 domain-containing protein [Acetivibrio sp.]
MNCDKFLELMEEYIMEELDEVANRMMEKHLSECEKCRAEYRETKEIIGNLRGIKESAVIKEDVLNMNKKNIVKKAGSLKNKRPFMRFVSGAAAVVFLGMFLLTASIVAFPSFASTYLPDVPVVKQLKDVQNEYNAIKQQNEILKKENEEIKQENEELKMRIKEIGGVSIPEYQTSEGINEEDNQRIQEMVIEFIRAIYRGDIEAAKKISTEEFKKELAQNAKHYLMINRGEILFTHITNVAKEGDSYMVFVRLNDGGDADISDYQWNFEFVKRGNDFLISFAGKDA